MKPDLLDNKGIKFKFYFRKKFYFIPKMTVKSVDFYKNSCFIDSKVKYEIIYLKTFYWFWFRFAVYLESIDTTLVDNTPQVEKFFDMLPNSIHIVGEVYYLNITKDNDEDIILFYKKKDDEKYLGDGVVKGKSLRIALHNMVMMLKNTDNLKHFRHKYKIKFEKFFNTEVPHERKFESYYE